MKRGFAENGNKKEEVTVGNIVKLFETKIPKEKQVKILSNPSLELQE